MHQLSQEAQKNILVVEDDPSLSRLWKRILTDMHCNHYQIFTSPREALEWLKNKQTDVLLTDLTLPEMNGAQLIRKAEEINPDIRTIVTSGYVGDTHQFAGIHSFLHIIPKPYSSIENLREFLLLFLEEADEISGVEEKEEEGMYFWDL